MTEERILDRVRKLLDRANHPNTNEHERDACIKKADAMMSQHSIDQALLDAAKSPEERRKPISREFAAWEGFAWRSQFATILSQICETAGVRSRVKYNGNTTMAGMSDDIGYAEMLWTTVYFAFCANLEPRWDNNLSFEHNVYNFKRAGRPWKTICETARLNDCWVDWPDGGRLIRAYKRHCRIIGEEPTNHTQRPQAYRESFARGFQNTICRRLEEMRRERVAAAKEGGASLVLYNVEQEISDLYFSLFPDEHPDVVKRETEKMLQKHAETAKQEQQAREDMLNRMTEKQRAAFLDKEERDRRREAAANERYWEQEARRMHDSGGVRAGREAGRSVDLSRGGPHVPTQRRAGELG